MRDTRPQPILIPGPTEILAAGNPPKIIRELIGLANSDSADISIARMQSPGGWSEPGQTPEFDEYTVVLGGVLHVEHTGGFVDVAAGQAAFAPRDSWVRYSTPSEEGADYLAICVPAFSSTAAHRDPHDSPTGHSTDPHAPNGQSLR